MRLSDLAYQSMEKIRINSLSMKRYSQKQGYTGHMEAAPNMRIVYILLGHVQYTMKGKVFQAGERSIVYIPPNTPYCAEWVPHMEQSQVIMDIDLRDDEGHVLDFGDQGTVLFRDEHHLYDGYFNEVVIMSTDDAPYRWLERMSLALKLCCEIARDRVAQDEGPRSARIYNALVFLQQNYAQNTPVEELARMCSLSLSTFRKLFFETKGISPVDYRNSLRIRKGVELLRKGEKPGDVARMVGIGDVKYFGKLCKKYTGLTPTQLIRSRPVQFPEG